MKNIYISLPMTGRKEADIEGDIMVAKIYLMKMFPGCRITSPLDIYKASKDLVDYLPDGIKYAVLMGKDIEHIIGRCDTVYFCVDPATTTSKGVRAEWEVAKVYNKEIIIVD